MPLLKSFLKRHNASTSMVSSDSLDLILVNEERPTLSASHLITWIYFRSWKRQFPASNFIFFPHSKIFEYLRIGFEY